MNLPPPHFSSLRLPRGELISYPTGRPNIRRITRQIQDFGYGVWVLHVDIAGFQRQRIPSATWFHAVILSRVILLLSEPEASSSSHSSSSDSASDRSRESSPDSGGVDSDNVDPDAPELGRF